ncbi:MAG TPA: hypothetical protein VGQ83_09490 [Polyangia bacterium]
MRIFGQNREHLGHAVAVARLGIVAAAVALTLCAVRWPGGRYEAGKPRANLAAFLSRAHGLAVDPADIAVPELPRGPLGGITARPVFFLAREGEAPRDAYVTDVAFSPAGVPLSASAPLNLTRTAAADESVVAARGARAAFASVDEGHAVVTIVDHGGETPAAVATLDRTQRWMNAVTNYQETGHLRGLDKRSLELAASRVPALRWTGPDTLAVGADHEYDARRGELTRGKAQVRVQQKSRRQPLHWAVDTARAISFIGPRGIAWMEDTFYELLDRARRAAGSAGTARDELLFAAAGDPGEPKIAGWPPPPFAPVLSKPEKGEGEWTLMHDPFIGRNPDAPAPFAQAFVRPDPQRPYAKVFFVAWDPQQVSLNMVAGTRDPRSQTGAIGEGVIPRDDATIKRVVGGFNGGWQSIHGQFGMMSDGKLVARPLPFCATAVRFKDGTFGIGSWPNDDSIRNVPIEIQSFRQNLFSIAEDGKFNPYGRESWGGGPGFITGTGPTTHIIRSGLCITGGGYPLYAWGTSLTGVTLAKAMIAAGCSYAMELDINAGHAGFEFYRVLSMPAGGVKKLSSWEGVKLEKNWATVGAVPGRPDLMYAMRRLSRHMGIQPFPRYIGKDWRDFMYLTLRPVLPGADVPPVVTPALPHEGEFAARDYYQGPNPYPPAVATAFLRPDAARPDARVELLRVDLRRVDVNVAVGSGEPAPTTGHDLRGTVPADATALVAHLGIGAAAPSAPRGLVVSGKRHFPLLPGLDTLAILAPLTPEGPPRVATGRWGEAVKPEPAQMAVVQGGAAAAANAPARVAGIGVDPDGILVYAVSVAGDAAAVRAALARAGCKSTALFPGAGPAWVREAKGGWRGLGLAPGEAAVPAAGESRLTLSAHPRWGAARVFTHQAPEKRAVWMKLLGPMGKSNKNVHQPASRPASPGRGKRGATPGN